MLTLIVFAAGLFIGLALHRAPALAGIAESASKLAGRIPIIGQFIRPANLI